MKHNKHRAAGVLVVILAALHGYTARVRYTAPQKSFTLELHPAPTMPDTTSTANEPQP
jgi:hypothetical protein